jgi:peptide/nickel transport system permease protein
MRERVVRVARRYPTMVLAMAVVALVGLIAAFSPWLFTSDPLWAWAPDRLQPPNSEHWFGTDFVGRDVYSRTLIGARTSLMVGFSVSLISVTAAVVIGLLVGYFRIADAIVMRFLDGLMSIPLILLALAMAALLGGSIQNVVIALSVVETPWATRVVRSQVLSLREQPFVESARAISASVPRILIRHILPNIWAIIIVQATFICADAIVVEAILTFLGAGVPPDHASWGTMMSEGRRSISQAIWVVGIPGAFLTTTVLAINVAGDGLRDILDPRLAHFERA